MSDFYAFPIEKKNLHEVLFGFSKKKGNMKRLPAAI